MSAWARYCFICVIWVMPQLVFAHMPIKGINDFYSGFLHPLFVPAHLLLLVSFGLFIGQKRLSSNPRILIVYISAIAIGLLFAWFSGDEKEIYVLYVATLIGLLIVANLSVGLNLILFVSVLAGLMLGMDSAQETLTGKNKFASLFGSGVAIYFLALYPMTLAEYLQKKSWGKIGIRIIGSWVATSAILVLALSLKK